MGKYFNHRLRGLFTLGPRGSSRILTVCLKLPAIYTFFSYQLYYSQRKFIFGLAYQHRLVPCGEIPTEQETHQSSVVITSTHDWLSVHLKYFVNTNLHIHD